MRLTKIYFKRLKAPLALCAGSLVGAIIGIALVGSTPNSMADVPIATIDSQRAAQAGMLLDGTTETDTLSVTLEPVITVEENFRNFSIIGYIENKERKVYVVQHPMYGRYTNFQLESLGFVVFPVNECELMVFEPDNPADRAMIFDQNCLTRQVQPENIKKSNFRFK